MRLAALLALVVLLALTGCGDDEPDDAPRTAFVAQADKICGQLNKDTAALADASFKDLTAPPTQAQLATYDVKSVQLQRDRLEQLRALTPPPGDEQRVAAIWAAFAAQIDAGAKAPLDDPGTPGGDRFAELAKAYGLKACGGTA